MGGAVDGGNHNHTKAQFCTRWQHNYTLLFLFALLFCFERRVVGKLVALLRIFTRDRLRCNYSHDPIVPLFSIFPSNIKFWAF